MSSALAVSSTAPPPILLFELMLVADAVDTDLSCSADGLGFSKGAAAPSLGPLLPSSGIGGSLTPSLGALNVAVASAGASEGGKLSASLLGAACFGVAVAVVVAIVCETSAGVVGASELFAATFEVFVILFPTEDLVDVFIVLPVDFALADTLLAVEDFTLLLGFTADVTLPDALPDDGLAAALGLVDVDADSAAPAPAPAPEGFELDFGFMADAFPSEVAADIFATDFVFFLSLLTPVFTLPVDPTEDFVLDFTFVFLSFPTAVFTPPVEPADDFELDFTFVVLSFPTADATLPADPFAAGDVGFAAVALGELVLAFTLAVEPADDFELDFTFVVLSFPTADATLPADPFAAGDVGFEAGFGEAGFFPPAEGETGFFASSATGFGDDGFFLPEAFGEADFLDAAAAGDAGFEAGFGEAGFFPPAEGETGFLILDGFAVDTTASGLLVEPAEAGES